MKKSGFVTGAFIVTLGIVITKILGILYVIPFYNIVGDQGGALYGYAYNIYTLFIALSSAGIPLAISKLVSEYHTKGYYKAMNKTFSIGKRLAILLGILVFVLLEVFSFFIASSIVGNVSGGNTVSDVTLVIRIVGFSVLIVPLLGVYRGFFEGHRFMGVISISQVLEQLIRVIIIVLGSFVALTILDLPLEVAVSISLIGTFIGAVISYIYLYYKKVKNKSLFLDEVYKVKEPKISGILILKLIVIYAFPFIMIDIFKSLYNYIDMFTVVDTLVNKLNMEVVDAESIMAMLSTWGAKFNMILYSVSTGIIVSLVPNLTASLIKGDKVDINRRISQSFNILLYFLIPMTIGIGFLADPIWNLFYGESVYGGNLLSYNIVAGLVASLFTLVISIIVVFKDYKTLIISLVSGVLIKWLFNSTLMISFTNLGLPSYYGAISSTIFGFLLSFIICMIVLNKKYGVSYEGIVKNLIDILGGIFIMYVILFIIDLVIPITEGNSLVIIVIYGIVGSLIYLGYTLKIGTVKNIFGNRLSYFKRK